MYDRVEEARMRLSSSVIRYGGEPTYVEEIYLADEHLRENLGIDPDEDEDIDYEELYSMKTPQQFIMLLLTFKESESIRVSIDDAGLDFEPVPLGFTANHLTQGRNPHYMWREPQRQYKQGLHSRTLETKAVEEIPNNRDRGIQIFSNLLCSTVMGQYTSLEDTLSFLENDITPEQYQYQQVFPFHREYALSVNTFGQLYLWHRTNRIATSDDGEVFHTLEEYAHLKEDLEEITKGVLKIATYTG